MKRIGIIAFSLFLGLSAFLFFFRVPVGTSLFIMALEQTGAKDIQIELTELNSSRVVFSQADCTLPNNGGRLSLQNIVLDWNRPTLAKKELDTIAIDALIVDLPEKDSTPSERKISIEQVLKYLDRFRKILLFRSFQIDRFILRGRSAGPLAGQELAFRLDKKDDSISGELFLKAQNLRLSLDTPDLNQWDLTLDQQGQTGPIFTTTVFLKKERLDAETEANLTRIGLLHPLFNTALPELKGTLRARLALTRDKETRADLMLDLRQLAVADISADSLQLALHGQMEIPGKFLLENNSLKGSGLHNNKFSVAGLEVAFDGALEQKDNRWQATLNTNNKTTVQNINGSNLHIESLQLSPDISGTFAENVITLNLNPQWQAQFSDIQSAPISLAEATLALASRQNTEIHVQLTNGHSWSVTPSDWQLTTSVIRLQQQELEAAPVHCTLQHLSGSGKDWHVKTRLSSDSLGIKTSRNTLPLRYISAEIAGNNDMLTGTATCVPKTVMGTLAIDFSHDLKQGKGRATINTGEPLLFSEVTPLSALVTPWPLPGDLTGGQLQIQSSLNWQAKQPFQLSLQANLSEGKGAIKEARFSGLTTSQDLQILPAIQSRKAGEITINEENTGITLRDISTRISLNPSPHGKIPTITLQDMTASLFGGTIHDKFLAIDPQRLEIENTITLSDIDLAQTITLHQVKGLEVEGRIHGTLPFRIDKSGLQIKKGSLQNASSGGIIRYAPPGGKGLQNSSLTGYALKALEEFHYELLTASTLYKPNGELQISLHLEGRSPKLETNRPVHLNITTEQNVLSLLQSLRYSKGLTDEIDKEVQKHYQQSAP